VPAEQPAGDELDRARAFIDSCRWTYASSVPEHPHEYVARSWLTGEQQGEFDWLVRLIDSTGYTARFSGSAWCHLDLDGRAYWASQSWYGPDAGRPATMLHRRRLDDGQPRSEVDQLPPWRPDSTPEPPLERGGEASGYACGGTSR
jgi:hypothetical protein